jgi:polyphosphate kinase
MQVEGIKLIFGIKVGTVKCVIERSENGKIKRYGFIDRNMSNSKNIHRRNAFTSHQILKDITKI